ncbi:hypothetical protein [Streptomyces sp. NPDC051219]|uniref:hypothetical protein n=1 Tax=Streptomyces sp. NPDC051219 TaxID=3155283 RepID=UPI0034317008
MHTVWAATWMVIAEAPSGTVIGDASCTVFAARVQLSPSHAGPVSVPAVSVAVH